jgi:hypothetical protein
MLLSSLKHSYVRVVDIPNTLAKDKKTVDLWNVSASLPISTVRVKEPSNPK